ncbi:Uncharacterised protein [Raoultella ornithinolytica]|nr:Uncharacterised protein [Raoultella ornithinolytica]
MLQFLLSYGTDPLLLDQPEDDLDCLMLSMSVIPAIHGKQETPAADYRVAFCPQ